MRTLESKLLADSGSLRRTRGESASVGESLNFQVNAGYLGATIAVLTAGALAELSEADMAGLAEFDSGGYEDAVNVDAGLALELEEHGDGSGVACAAAEDQPPQARMAPVRVQTRREGSICETAFISIAHGIVGGCTFGRLGTMNLTPRLSVGAERS